MARYLAPALLGKTMQSGSEVPALLARVREHRMAKAALENAVWDAEAQEKSNSAVEVAGRHRSARLPAASASASRIRTNNCCRRLKLSWPPDTSASRSRSSRGGMSRYWRRFERAGPDILLSCDANSAYTLDDIDHLKRFDRSSC